MRRRRKRERVNRSGHQRAAGRPGGEKGVAKRAGKRAG